MTVRLYRTYVTFYFILVLWMPTYILYIVQILQSDIYSQRNAEFSFSFF